ncbi:hypothetical protein Trydic_g973 [Trypoxylus dichotomus]
MCAAATCSNTYRNSTASFFRFPKDPERAKKWVLACGRTELLNRIETLHYTTRVCGEHFESRMFLNNVGNRLQADAVPTKFISETEMYPQNISPSWITYWESERKKKHGQFNASHSQATNQPPTERATQPQATTVTNSVVNSQQNPTSSVNNAEGSHISTRRPSDVRFSLSGKRELRRIVRRLEAENTNLRKQIQGNLTQQSDSTSNSSKDGKYSTEFNEYSLSLYFLGPKLYKEVFAKKLCLPTTKLLRNFVGQTSFSPGVTQSTIDLLKTKFENFQQTHKFCTLCIDEIKLTPGLFYGTSSDVVVGFKDLGNDMRKFKPALKALTIMAKGFYVDWQQPVAYYFLDSPTSGDILKDFIVDTIAQLSKIDLRVVAVIPTMRPNTRRIAKVLNITPESPCFSYEDQKIVFLYNTEDLLSASRKDLIDKSFTIGDKTTNWTHLLKFFNHDKKHAMKAAPSLTLSHLCPNKQENRKTKIKYSRQIFNDKVVPSMNLYIRFQALPPDTEATLEFIRRISDLRSVLNKPSSTEASKRKRRILKGVEYFEDTYDFFNNLQTLSKEGKSIDGMPPADSILGWKITVKGIQILFEVLAKESLALPSDLTINHSCLRRLKNSFKNSNKRSVNPSPIKFYRAFKKFFCQNLITSGIGSYKEDYDKMSAKLAEMPANQYSTEIKTLVNLDLDYQRSNELGTDFAKNICHYLLLKCSAQHTCQICGDYMTKCEELYDTTLPYYAEPETVDKKESDYRIFMIYE